MCLDCGCVLDGTGQPDDDHGDPRHITLSDLMAAADASSVAPLDAAAMIGASLATVTAPASDQVTKSDAEQQFVLGIAYQAGADTRIRKGVDGRRDYFTPAELEKAAWSFMLDPAGRQHGLYHVDGTEGAGVPVETSIYRNPVPWVVARDLVVKSGDWLLGSLLGDPAWNLVKTGKANGWSPQGVARRRRKDT